jgi:type I restriction enzyme S subunit
VARLIGICCNEQRRIVDKLERICDRNRTARNELSHIPKLIARYKQAVLAAAFRGDLTADWREKHGKMRTQWQNVSLDNLISCYQNGLSKRSGNDGQEIIVVRLADIKDFKVCLSDPRKIKLTEKEEEKYKNICSNIKKEKDKLTDNILNYMNKLIWEHRGKKINY